MDALIPLAKPHITEEDRLAVSRVLESGVLSRGPWLEKFESLMATTVSCKYAIGLSNGTAAIHCSLLGANVGQGDEVICGSYTVPASLNPIVQLGAKPVLADIDPISRAISVSSAKNLISPRTKAILLVHPFGQPADILGFSHLCEQYDLTLIEDSCEALGTEIQQQALGSFGLSGCFGFYPNKQITSGEGGMLVTNNEQLAQNCRRWRNHGRTMDGRWLDQDSIGFNYRLSEINAALGFSQLSRLAQILKCRQQIATRYHEQLSMVEQIDLPSLPENCTAISWFAYVIQLKPEVPAENRDKLIAKMAKFNIQTGRYFAPLHLQPAMSAFPELRRNPLPVTQQISARSLALPFFDQLGELQINRVCQSLIRCLRNL